MRALTLYPGILISLLFVGTPSLKSQDATPPSPQATAQPSPPKKDSPPTSKFTVSPSLKTWIAKEDASVDLLQLILDLSDPESSTTDRKPIQNFIEHMARKVKSIRANVDSPTELVVEWSFHTYVDLKFQYVPEGTVLIGPSIQSRQTTSIGFATLYLLVARQLDLPLSAALAGDHIFCVYGDPKSRINIEFSEMGDILPDRYYALRHGSNPSILTDRQFVGLLLYQLSNRSRARGANQDATTQLEAAANLYPNHAGIHASLGLLALQKGDETRAVQYFEKAIVNGSRNVSIHIHRAKLLRDPNQIRDALSAYDVRLGLDSNDLTAILGKACLLNQLGRHRQAVDFLESAAQKMPPGPDRTLILTQRDHFQEKRDLEVVSTSGDFEERILALERLQSRAQSTSVPILIQLLKDPNYRIRWAAAYALKRITEIDDKRFQELSLDPERWHRWWSRGKKSP